MIWKRWEMSAGLAGRRDLPETNLIKRTLSSLLKLSRMLQNHWISWWFSSISRYLCTETLGKHKSFITKMILSTKLVVELFHCILLYKCRNSCVTWQPSSAQQWRPRASHTPSSPAAGLSAGTTTALGWSRTCPASLLPPTAQWCGISDHFRLSVTYY